MRNEVPDPTQPAATDVGALGALPPVLDPRALAEVAGGINVPLAMPFSLPGSEGEVKAMHPPMAGSDPRGLPPQALAVGIGSVPGGTGAPGYYFLPLPSGGSPFMPGEAPSGKLPTPPPTPAVGGAMPAGSAPGADLPAAPAAPPASVPGPSQAPAAPATSSLALPGMPAASGVEADPSKGLPAVPSVPSVPAVPEATSAVPPVPEAPMPSGTQATIPPGTPDPFASPGGGAMPAPPAGAEGTRPDLPPPESPEDQLALDLALDLSRRMGESASEPEHAVLGQFERPDLMPHLPTSDAALRDLLQLAAGPNAPSEVPTSGVPGTQAVPTDDLYFLPSAPAVPAVGEERAPAFDPHVVRRDFPALHQNVNGKPLVWLDNAATTHKPQSAIDAVSRYYEKDNSNIHRAAHALAARATEAYENARDTVRRFLGASESEEIVFARGTTEAINLVMNAWGRKHIKGGDEIVLTLLEHHANIVPWQMLRQMTGCVLKVVPVTDRGEVIMEEYTRLLGPRTKLVAATQVSNALGTVVPVKEMATLAHRHGAMMLVDGAQSVPHLKVDVQDMGADFFVFSGHKIFAPMGIGALYARKELLEDMEPWQGGGSMIVDVTFDRTVYSPPPAKFEAGTPSVGDAVGLGAALDYVERIGLENMARYEDELLEYGTEMLKTVPGLKLIGTAPHKVSVMSFLIEGTRPEDVGRYLNTEGIAVRAGHHCAQPTVRRFGTEGTVRPSLALYNTREDVDRLVDALKKYKTSGN